MKILYVTDLHGDKNKYWKSLEEAIKKDIKVYFHKRIFKRIFYRIKKTQYNLSNYVRK